MSFPTDLHAGAFRFGLQPGHTLLQRSLLLPSGGHSADQRRSANQFTCVMVQQNDGKFQRNAPAVFSQRWPGQQFPAGACNAGGAGHAPQDGVR